MELIVISENKLKIMMSAPDMEFYGLDEDEFYCSVSNTRKILERILKNSPVMTGFETISPDDKILIQLYPEKSGGCELFVTRLSLCEADNTQEDAFYMPDENEEKLLLPTPQKRTVTARVAVKPTLTYSFEKFDYVCLACRELVSRRFAGDSSLYRADSGKYYLFIGTKSDENEKSSPSSFLSEFGELENTENVSLILLEHGTCVCPSDAVQTFSEL